MKRRTFLQGSALTAGALTLPLVPRVARAAEPGDLNYIFVFNSGGYDPTRVFATEFDNRNVDMESGSELGSVGNIDFVDHAARPSVRSFFESYGDRSLVLNGMLVRSIAHDICTMIAMTGNSSGTSPDWPAVLASDRRDQFILPHLVLGGPSYPGDLGVAVARTGQSGQLDELLSGEALAASDMAVTGPSRPYEGVMDRYLERRAAARADYAASALGAQLTADFSHTLDQAGRLKDMQYLVDFGGDGSLTSASELAVEALRMRIARCITLQYSGGGATGWDTHGDNDDQQSPMWETLFSGLSGLVQLLERTPGAVEDSLLDETCIVVLSEMGRTPQLNAFNGKDHWPYTSAMLVGAGFNGDRVIGGFDDSYYGLPVDTTTGDIADSGEILSAETLGATLLAMADVDPDEYLNGIAPIDSVLA
ncbi:MAG: DUF1501 domain-containing protein [Proteobacteria bacterium]|nr:DUF1501 domain-containing protein [Pseudomonadota bacterium]MCP4917708.1 DUF1501 domain-containing protein [Pseudomonadota bacterium]